MATSGTACVYERVPHITLKSIANNAEIDVIWDQWQAKLEPLREKLNAAVKKTWQEWEIPRRGRQSQMARGKSQEASCLWAGGRRESRDRRRSDAVDRR